jgi:hypothetical protein
MSIILRLNKNLSKFSYDCNKLLQNKLITFASYSRRSNSKNSDSPYKIVKAKIGKIKFENYADEIFVFSHTQFVCNRFYIQIPFDLA